MGSSLYLNVFIEEVQEHLLTLNQSLLELELDPNLTLIDKIFRSTHTLKGASATMGFNKMANLTHAMEDVLSKIRSQELVLDSKIINALFESVDMLEVLTNKIGEGIEEDIEIIGMVQGLRSFNSPKPLSSQNEQRLTLQLRYSEAEKEQIMTSVNRGSTLCHVDVTLVENCFLKAARVFMVLHEIEKLGKIVKSNPTIKELEDEKFDRRFIVGVLSENSPEDFIKTVELLLDVEKISVEKPEPSQILLEKRIQDKTDHDKNKIVAAQTVRVEIKKLDDLMNLVGELVINRSRLESLGSTLGRKDLNEVVEQIGRLTLDLRDNVLKTRMVPIETVFSRFPRLVRDLSKELGKKIDLEIHGGDTELDRTVIDEIGDPLVHIIRNAVDHGIEPVEEREKNQKPFKGKIMLHAFQDGNTVVIKVNDDGRGFDVKKVKEKAVKSGIISSEALMEMRDTDILEITFLPGFSTVDQVTNVSGRGVGMDVVKAKVDSLGGFVNIESEYMEGSTITIRLPLTLAIIQTLIFEVGYQIYAIPTNYIEQIVCLKPEDIKRINKQEVTMLREELVPLVRVQDILGTRNAINRQSEGIYVVVLNVGDRLIGCIVDNILWQQDVVIKSLGGYLGSVKGVSGATILGDGRVALILDVRGVA